jgi:nitrite reductase (NO-forming)
MSETETVYRTSSARTGKMMIIMLGICIVGGAIFFGMWDYWISQPPPVLLLK